MSLFDWLFEKLKRESGEETHQPGSLYQKDEASDESFREEKAQQLLTNPMSYEAGLELKNKREPESSIGEIVLLSGRTIKLQKLEQWVFNSGLIMGSPRKKRNSSEINNLLTSLKADIGWEPFLVTPPEMPIFADDEMNRPDLHLKGDEAYLPPYVCIGRFDSHGISHANDVLYKSSLSIVWFQWDFAFPIDPDILSEIKSISWEKYAKEWEM